MLNQVANKPSYIFNFNMTRFIQQTLIIILVTLTIAILGNVTLGFSPKVYSNSVSLNAKIFDIKRNHLKKKPALLCFGSSMSLNNIYSQSFAKNIDTNFINISSWGQSIEFTFRSIQYFDNVYNQNLVIVPCNIGDFHKTRTSRNPFEQKGFTQSLFNPYDIELNFLKRESREYHKLKREVNSYNSLAFDYNGGVSLNKKDFLVDSNRWNPGSLNHPDIEQYSYLDSIINLSLESEFKVIFVQTPIRKSYLDSLDPAESQILSDHLKKVELRCDKYHVGFINGLDFLPNDSHYVDYSHLSSQGSRIFSDSLVELILIDQNDPTNIVSRGSS